MQETKELRSIYGIVTYNDGRKRVCHSHQTDINSPFFTTSPGTFIKRECGIYLHKCFPWTFVPYPSKVAAEAALKK